MSKLQEIAWAGKPSRSEVEIGMPGRDEIPGRVNLYRVPWIRPLIESRWPQFLVRALTLAGFIFTIFAGLFGARVGSHNFAIIFVWIVWWTALNLAFIPLGGRAWCSVCPIPLPGEWLQQGGLLERSRRRFGLNHALAKTVKRLLAAVRRFLADWPVQRGHSD